MNPLNGYELLKNIPCVESLSKESIIYHKVWIYAKHVVTQVIGKDIYDLYEIIGIEKDSIIKIKYIPADEQLNILSNRDILEYEFDEINLIDN